MDEGQAEYRERVNEFLRRADVMYELTASMTIERLGPESVRPVLRLPPWCLGKPLWLSS